jgi:regulator of protease activity HflC (stomatin/prohibitin superfamily)
MAKSRKTGSGIGSSSGLGSNQGQNFEEFAMDRKTVIGGLVAVLVLFTIGTLWFIYSNFRIDVPQKKQKTGIQSDTLPPGLYPINSKEQQIDIVEIGYRESTIHVKSETDDGKPKVDATGQPVVADTDSGIRFPSNDGFAIQIDSTTIWGILPAQAPDIIRTFGNLVAVEDKVIRPQMESISRNKGSQYSAVELLVGEKRQKFQEETAASFGEVLKSKNLSLLYCLVRHIYIPTQVREPIQMGFIADELKLTRDQEQLTAKMEGDLREAEKGVDLEAQKVTSDTEKKAATLVAEGKKTVAETDAETVQLVATIDKKVADLQAQATVVKGEASAKSDQLSAEAKAQKFALAVQAFGSGDAYNQWVFASGLPDNVELNLLYAGPGTFWTDLDGFTNKLLGKQLSNQQQATETK